uniref:Uncharacterized protein n=1 Tax=Strix occidentalis caurina TaxID=311401 RepID=A0A8D0KSQ5_STROC
MDLKQKRNSHHGGSNDNVEISADSVTKHCWVELGPRTYSTSAIHLHTSTPISRIQNRPKGGNLRSVCSMLVLCFSVSKPNSLESSRNASSSSSPLNLKGSLDHIHGRTESLSSEDTVPSREAPALLRDTYPFRSASAVLSPSSRHELSSHRNGLISYDIPQKSTPSQSYTGRQRSASPGSEMVTLEEFLEESNRLSSPSDTSSNRDDLLSDYFRKANEPSATGNLLVQPSRKEAAKMPTSLVAPAVKMTIASEEGRTAKPGNYMKPNLRQVEPEAFSLASADLLRATGPETASVPTSSQATLRERPQSAKVAGSLQGVDSRCRQLDARRLSLAPPKDEGPLSFHQFSASPTASSSNLNVQQQERVNPGQHYSPTSHTTSKVKPKPAPRTGEVATVAPARAVSSSTEGNISLGQGQGDALLTKCQGKVPEGSAGAVEEPLRGSSSSSAPGSPDPQGDQQTVWYEYGCV